MDTSHVASIPRKFTESPTRLVPPIPETIQDTGISQGAITDLLLKILYVQGARTGQQLVDIICLSSGIVDDLLLNLQQRQIIEVRGTTGPSRMAYLFDLTSAGRDRARDAIEANQYVGPAPVPFAQYRRWVEAQTIRNVHVNRRRIEEGFSGVVLQSELFETLGPAINSAKSLFLYGDSGNGKTLIAESIASLLGGAIYVPHAVDIDGQTMLVYDQVYHRPPAKAEESSNTASALWRNTEDEYDRRFVRVRRPVVMAGGELTLEQLDLQYDPFTKIYQAPFQVKANGGVLIIDDFGRQRVPPRDLLNRWIVPLEKRLDFMTLHTGSKFPVPFDCLLIISTNLEPTDLVEEAFLRRIHYKVHVGSPSPDQYAEIFRRVCSAVGIPFLQSGVDYIYREFYTRREIPARSCHPRDILDHVLDVARFQDTEPALNEDLLYRACDSYFIDVASLGGAP